MKNLKKVLLLTLSVLMIFAMCACDNSSEGNKEETTVNETKPLETKPVETEPADDKITYTVKVTDESGAPLANVMVQLCKDACVPGRTNEEGVAEFNLVKDEYKAGFLSIPEGYALQDETVTDFYFEDGATEITLVLKAIG